MAVVGFAPLVFGVVALIDLLYQYWVHTQQIGHLGWFDRWFCSPSNHRVHHAVNAKYLDKNYGGILIVWDRLFGSSDGRSAAPGRSARCVASFASPVYQGGCIRLCGVPRHDGLGPSTPLNDPEIAMTHHLNRSLNRSLVLLGALSALMLTAFDASASLRVRCETRSDRSRASVDGSNLASGNYSAVLISGTNRAQSPLEHTVGDEVEFDFDSNRRDIRQGATPISKDFIVGGQATGKLLNEGGAVIASKTVACRNR